MANRKDTTTVGMHLSKEDRDRIKEEADRQHRTISSLLKSIVLPEINRREDERDHEPPKAAA